MEPKSIKIVEFDEERDEPQTSGRAAGSSGAMKIREFAAQSDGTKQRIATPQSVGSIKILEFDDPLGAQFRTQDAASAPARVPDPAAIKIVEYDKDETQAAEAASAKPGVKIKEFD